MTTYSFSEYMKRFFENYLLNQRNLSTYTIKSYKTTFKLFINYLISEKNIKIPLDKAGDLLYNSRIFFNRKGDTAMFAAGMMMCMCRMMMCFCCEPNAGTSVCR